MQWRVYRDSVWACRLVEADVLVASEGLNPTNPADDDELETPAGGMAAQLSTSAPAPSYPLLACRVSTMTQISPASFTPRSESTLGGARCHKYHLLAVSGHYREVMKIPVYLEIMLG